MLSSADISQLFVDNYGFPSMTSKEHDFLPVHKTRPSFKYNFPLHGLSYRSVCKILSESNEGKQKLSLQFRFNV
jgi:hypothetical protein